MSRSDSITQQTITAHEVDPNIERLNKLSFQLEKNLIPNGLPNGLSLESQDSIHYQLSDS
jgi:hypothetical protein